MEFWTFRGLCLEVILQIVALKTGQKCLWYNCQPPFIGACGQPLVVTLIAFFKKQNIKQRDAGGNDATLTLSFLPLTQCVCICNSPLPHAICCGLVTCCIYQDDRDQNVKSGWVALSTESPLSSLLSSTPAPSPSS